MALADLGLSESKGLVDRLLIGEEVVVEFASRDDAEAFLEGAQSLGAEGRLQPTSDPTQYDYRVLVHGRTPGVGDFFQTVWSTGDSVERAVGRVAAYLCSVGDVLVGVEKCVATGESVPEHPSERATGRTYFPAE